MMHLIANLVSFWDHLSFACPGFEPRSSPGFKLSPIKLQQSLKKSSHPNSAVYPEEKGGLGKEAWQQFSAEKSALAL